MNLKNKSLKVKNWSYGLLLKVTNEKRVQARDKIR